MPRTDDRPLGRLSFKEVAATWDRVAALGMDWKEHPVQRGFVDYGLKLPRHENQGQVVDYRVHRLGVRHGTGEILGRAIVGEGYVVSAWSENPSDQCVFASLIGTDAPA